MNVESVTEVSVEAEGSESGGGEEKLVPVSESIRYRKRAQQAESELEALRAECARLEASLATTGEELASVERRAEVDRVLIESETIDLEAARLLTEQAVMAMDDADVREAVEDLKRHKPYLFRRVEGGGGMSPRGRYAGGVVDEAAAEAVASGDRRDLLRYLRLRRRGVA